MAGAVGFEPTVHEIKTRCLTTWLRPIVNWITLFKIYFQEL